MMKHIARALSLGLVVTLQVMAGNTKSLGIVVGEIVEEYEPIYGDTLSVPLITGNTNHADGLRFAIMRVETNSVGMQVHAAIWNYMQDEIFLEIPSAKTIGVKAVHKEEDHECGVVCYPKVIWPDNLASYKRLKHSSLLKDGRKCVNADGIARYTKTFDNLNFSEINGLSITVDIHGYFRSSGRPFRCSGQYSVMAKDLLVVTRTPPSVGQAEGITVGIDSPMLTPLTDVWYNMTNEMTYDPGNNGPPNTRNHQAWRLASEFVNRTKLKHDYLLPSTRSRKLSFIEGADDDSLYVVDFKSRSTKGKLSIGVDLNKRLVKVLSR